MSDNDELKGEIVELVKALEAASSAQLTEAEQRLRASLERALARINELEAKAARLDAIEGRLARIGELDQKLGYVIAAVRHLKPVVEPLLQNWDTFFAGAPPALAVNLSSFRSALTVLQTDIGHLVV